MIEYIKWKMMDKQAKPELSERTGDLMSLCFVFLAYNPMNEQSVGKVTDWLAKPEQI